MSLFPISFSRVNTFENCQAQFDYLYVSKQVQDQGSTHTEYGTRVHEQLEKFARDRAAGLSTAIEELSDREAYAEVKDFLPLVERCIQVPGDHYFEYQMAINEKLVAVDWFAADVWLRSIADVLIINEPARKAYILDWKTGKVKANPLQLKLFACMVMFLFPNVDEVSTAFVWLKYNDVTIDKYSRQHLQATWDSIYPRLKAVQEAVDLGVFRPRPSPLCKWCSAKGICPSARR